MNIKSGDTVVDNGISYVIETDEFGQLWGVSNNAEHEIEIDENFECDAHFPSAPTKEMTPEEVAELKKDLDKFYSGVKQ